MKTLWLALWVAAAGAAERPASFVRLSEVDRTIVQEIRYHGSDNFIGAPVKGYVKPQCWLTRQAAEALARAQKELRLQSLSLKVFDCYRPQRAVDHIKAWARDLKDTKRKAEYYPNVPKEKLFDEGYVALKSGHSRGSTVDLTLVDAGRELDMGTPWDFFDPKAHTMNTALPPKARDNRERLVGLMERHGFQNYEKEWWHYTLVGEPYPDTYFDFPVD